MRRVLRRSFILQACKAAGALLLPARFRNPPEFHLHPHYREQPPVEALFLRIKPGLDEFVTEPVHDKLAGVLAAWSAGLLQSPGNIQALELALSPNFSGATWRPSETLPVRPESLGLRVERLRFPAQTTLSQRQFLVELRASLSGFSQLLTAEFQIISIKENASEVQTRVRYELVGTGAAFFREQRSGHWLLQWNGSDQAGYQLIRWQSEDETRSRARERFYVDVAQKAFGGNSSFPQQMSHGADYWRTILDGATGVDIYGHNGVSVGDISGDGLDDIYVCQPAGLPNRLYRNRGDGTFEDITEASGVGILDNTACALFADFDNDGRQDLVVVRASGPLLFLNQGNGTFRQKPDAFKFATPPQGTFTGAAAADYNRNGHLDIYFCLYTYYQGTDQYKYPIPYFAAENGPPNFLMRNNGDGTFRDVTAECGLDKNNTRFSFCCGWGDYNRDGWPDLYVVNDFGRKNLYRNNGDGTFTDVAPELGVQDIGAGMSVCWLDYDNDGNQDLYVGNMWTAAGERISTDEHFQTSAPKPVQEMYRQHAMGNSLFRNAANGFLDKTEDSGTAMGRWAWSCDAWDFDHDGFPDIYIANGMISGPTQYDLNSFFWREVVAKSPNTSESNPEYEKGWNAINELIRSDHSWSGYERNVLYANNRDGTFSDVSGTLGLDFLEDSRAFSLADFDGDGRQEILVKNRSAPQLRLMKNILPDLPGAIAFHLRGIKSNPDAIGASVTIQTSVGNQTKMLQAGSGFLSQHSKEMFFGLGKAQGMRSATISWPSGLKQQLQDLPVNHRVFVTEGRAQSRVEPFKPRSVDKELPASPLGELLPDISETWMLVPVLAPDFAKTLSAFRGAPILLSFLAVTPSGLEIHLKTAQTSITTTIKDSDDVTAIYNLLFRYLFDRHQDMGIPTSFLINELGEIVKVYQGPVSSETANRDLSDIPASSSARLAKALPFPGVSDTYSFGRNYLSLGSIFFQHGYVDSAAEFFQSALRDDPASAEALYGLGSSYLKQGKNAQAQRSFDQAVQLKGSYPETLPNAWNNLGLLATREGDTDTAISYFQRAIQLNPNHFVALENLGNAYKQQKRWPEARTTLEKALSVNPQDAEANYSLGMVFAQTDSPDLAYSYLRKALELRPTYPEALNNLGILYLRTHRRDDAVAAFQECIRKSPAFDQAYLNLARVYAIEGQTDQARKVLTALLELHPDNQAAKQALSQLP